MVAKISGGSGGSCRGLAEYLEKEIQGLWFSHDQVRLAMPAVVAGIDANKKNLGQQEEKYYQVIISPSQRELAHLGTDPAKLEAYTREVMERYAQNFGKGIESKDLVWYAKIEQGRTHSHQDRAVQTGEAAKGQAKEGPQTHVHIIVSRTENLARYQERKQTGELDRKNPLKLSPATHHRNTSQGAVTGGFDRTAFKQAAEQAFDQRFSYERPLTETFAYANVMDKGSEAERLSMRQAVQQQERSSTQRQQVGQSTDSSLAPKVVEQPVQQVQPEPLAPGPIPPKLSEREELIKQMLEKLDQPTQQTRQKQNGLSL